MVILQQVLNFESVSLDYFCSNMVFGPCWVSGIILWLDKNIPLYTLFFPPRTRSYQMLLCFKGKLEEKCETEIKHNTGKKYKKDIFILFMISRGLTCKVKLRAQNL